VDINKAAAIFYGYATEDYGSCESDFENEGDLKAHNLLIDEHWVDSIHSDKETDIIDSPNTNRPLPTPPSVPKESQRKSSVHDITGHT